MKNNREFDVKTSFPGFVSSAISWVYTGIPCCVENREFSMPKQGFQFHEHEFFHRGTKKNCPM